MTELNTENNTVEVSDMEDTEVSNTTPLEEAVEPVEEEINQEIEEPDIPEEEYVCPWADAPENTIYYERMYEDGHLGSFTESAEMAYKFNWFNNRISKDDVEQCEINGWTYLKDKCPHKSQEQVQQEAVTQRITEIQIAVQNLLDSKAQEKLYDNAFAICSYANSTDETFYAEANQFIAWRDQCWRKCYEILALFQNGDIPMPTVGEVLRQLPTLDWE